MVSTTWSAVAPGVIRTPITRRARLRGRAASQGMREQMVALYERRNYAPERVARNILRAVQRNRAVAPVSPEAWLLYYAKRLAPGLVRHILARGERTHFTRPSPP